MTELRGHHLIPQGQAIVDRIAQRYQSKFGGTLTQAQTWARSIIDSPINIIPLPNQGNSGISLPEHSGGPLASYQDNVIREALARIRVRTH